MRICLNGKEHGLGEASTIEALILALELDTRKIAVEVNLTIVPRSLYAETQLKPDDTVEIVRFIGGG